MRNTFINRITEHASKNKNIWLITGDLGYSVLDTFAREFPERYLNAGVAEQNMTGVAVGIALQGQTVFTYSIANFPTFRCLEQIRNDICYHQANVKIVSVGAGLSYGTHGYTHYGIEDIAIMRSLPNMSILSPSDPIEAVRIADISVQHKGPLYIRLGKNGEPKLHSGALNFEIGDLIPIIPGKKITILATGAIAAEGIKAASELKKDGYDVGLWTLPTLKPLNLQALKDAVIDADSIFTLEEHVETGGLFGIIAESLQKIGLSKKVHSLSVPAKIPALGTQGFLLKALKLDHQGIIDTIKASIMS